MNELYVVQCHDDPYCAPYAATICETLEAAIQASQGQDDFCYIELFVKQGNCFKSAKRLFNEKGQEIDSMGLRKYNVGDDVDMITSEDESFDDEIAEALRLAGVKLNEAVQVGRYRYKTVSDLMNELQNCDPEAVVIVSEKWGRGAAQFHIRAGYTDTNYLEVIGSQEPTEEYPTKAIEISAAM